MCAAQAPDSQGSPINGYLLQMARVPAPEAAPRVPPPPSPAGTLARTLSASGLADCETASASSASILSFCDSAACLEEQHGSGSGNGSAPHSAGHAHAHSGHTHLPHAPGPAQKGSSGYPGHAKGAGCSQPLAPPPPLPPGGALSQHKLAFDVAYQVRAVGSRHSSSDPRLKLDDDKCLPPPRLKQQCLRSKLPRGKDHKCYTVDASIHLLLVTPFFAPFSHLCRAAPPAAR